MIGARENARAFKLITREKLEASRPYKSSMMYSFDVEALRTMTVAGDPEADPVEVQQPPMVRPDHIA